MAKLKRWQIKELNKPEGGRSRNTGSYLNVNNAAVRGWAKNKEREVLASTEKNIGKQGHVYICSLGYDDLYKIGKAKNLARRLKELRAGNPRLKFRWSAHVTNMNESEKRLHRAFRTRRIEREIFRLSERDIFRAGRYISSS